MATASNNFRRRSADWASGRAGGRRVGVLLSPPVVPLTIAYSHKQTTRQRTGWQLLYSGPQWAASSARR